MQSRLHMISVVEKDGPTAAMLCLAQVFREMAINDLDYAYLKDIAAQFDLMVEEIRKKYPVKN